MQQARRRDLRRELEHRQFNEAREANEPLLAEALEIRRRIAALLGYPSWAHYAIEVKMARDPEAVRALLRRARSPAARRAWPTRSPASRRSCARTARSRPCGPGTGATATRASAGATSRWIPTSCKQYLPLEAVFDGLLGLCAEVFGLAFERDRRRRGLASGRRPVPRAGRRDRRGDRRHPHGSASPGRQVRPRRRLGARPGEAPPGRHLPAAAHRHRGQPAAARRGPPGAPASRRTW